MPDYRDYGTINGATPPSPTKINTNKRTQVYDATHDGAGNYLPYMNRSFISFSFGGKNIEDFNLLAIIENNSLQKKLYADFTDNVTESDVWDGQIYWSTHFNSNNLDFTLFTDGITENLLDSFKQYFMPGKIAELIVSEHPNRAIMARISAPPQTDMLPFEEKIKIKIAGRELETSTTLYKGSISLNFVMDDPFWYSKINILDELDEGEGEYHSGKWIDANGQETLILDDKDALKVLKEDGVPFSDMLLDASEPSSSIIDPHPQIVLFGTENALTVDTSMSATGSRVGDPSTNLGARTDSAHVAYVILNEDAGIPLGPGVNGYFFYAGNAACYPVIKFTLTPLLDINGYISMPANKYTNSVPYNTITIESTKSLTFKFTTPSIYTGYNQVIDIFRQTSLSYAAWEYIRAAIRDNVKHWAPRQYANYVIDTVIQEAIEDLDDQLPNNILHDVRATPITMQRCQEKMQDFLKDEENLLTSANFTINCKNGQATAQFIYRDKFDQLVTTIENVGDMICSSYLVIKERNEPDENGFIQPWTDDPQVENGKKYSYKISADCNLTNFNIQYRYLYL